MTAIIQGDMIVLLNADMNELARIPFQRAARLLAKDKAVIVESDPLRKLGSWAWPKVLRLKEYVYIAWEKLNGPPKVSKRGVLLRDQHKCAYCGGYAATIDHITPRSAPHFGKNTWQNLTAACISCNHKKGNKTLEQCGMKLRQKPYVPRRSQLRG
jgi:5-methylcytosine-specific restriction endonuclease McrA